MDYYRNDPQRPAPLSAAAEAALFRRYRHGRKVSRDRIRNEIVRQYLFWAAELASRYSGPRFDNESAVSAANLGLMRAIENYNPSRNWRFVTHSFFYIRDAITTAMRREGYAVDPTGKLRSLRSEMKRRGLSLKSEEFLRRKEEIFRDAEQDTQTLPEHEETLPLRPDDMPRVLRQHIARLPELQAKILQTRYLEGEERCLTEVGRLLGLSPHLVAGLQAKAFATLRRQLSKEI
jgi:RNA polymerase primary sigma factor